MLPSNLDFIRLWSHPQFLGLGFSICEFTFDAGVLFVLFCFAFYLFVVVIFSPVALAGALQCEGRNGTLGLLHCLPARAGLYPQDQRSLKQRDPRPQLALALAHGDSGVQLGCYPPCTHPEL